MKFKIGDKIKATIMRTGGALLEVTGVVAGFETAFGREDVVIKNGKLSSFVVNEKNVALQD